MAAEPEVDSSKQRADDIAIIGLACRFPGGASDEAKLWDLLSNRKSAFTEVPSSRFNVDAYHHPSTTKLNTLNSRGAHFLTQDVAAFDAPFFGITAQEANAMDPAARMLLEVTFEALENAGQKLENIAGSDTSCYVGCFTRDYHEMLYRDIESVPMYTGTGTGFSLLSNRISWFYDLRGPSMTLDTACSSSLVGLHLACRGLQAGESKMAVVCGANVILSPDIALTLSNLHMLSTDGLSKSFAEGTTGYGRGEGIASLILKRVDDALRDGDPIRAVIRGSGVNQDGHTKGITLPNSDAQADLIRAVYSSVGLDPSATGYFEAHGTGTQAGDPLELGAIAKSISRTRKSDDKLFVGSIKSNIGHLEGAAGVAGVIKCVLMLEKAAILPNIHFEKPNRRIPFDQWRIQVPTALMSWPTQLRRASVNSFGYGGTNAHVIIDDSASYLQKHKPKRTNGQDGFTNAVPSTKTHLILLSARDEAALERLRQSYSDYITDVSENAGSIRSDDESSYLDDLAYTLGYRRSILQCRASITISSLSELKESLGAKKLVSTKIVALPRVGFVFTGQGAQWAGMGLELMNYPVFDQSVREADRYLTATLNSKWSALEELEKAASDSQIELAEFSQPLCTVLQVALVDLLSSWRILPASVVGHSSGEIGAAYSCGAITKQDAWKISYLRGQICSKLPLKAPHLRGSMMAVGLSPEAARPYIDAVKEGKVVIACVNSPSSVTLSGDETGIDEVLVALKSQNIFARKLKVQNAYHSHHMHVLADEYLRALDGMTSQTPATKGTVKMASSVTGKLVTHSELGPTYWVKNLVSPVLFSEAVEILIKQPTKGRRQTRATEPAFNYLVEIGPHAALKGPLRQILQTHGASQIPYSSVLMRGEDGCRTAVATAGALFCHGAELDIEEVNNFQGCPSTLSNIPPYPWNHSLKYWADSRISRSRQDRKSGRHDLFGAPAQDSDDLEPRWRHFLRVADNPWIRDHVVHSSILYPGSGILAMPLHALQTLADPRKEVESIQLKDVHIVKAIVVPDDQFGLEVFLRLRRQRPNNGAWSGWWEFSVCSNQENDHVEEHSFGVGKIHYRADKDASVMSENEFVGAKFKREFEKVQKTNTASISPLSFYEAAKSVGLAYGPSFQGLEEINVGKGSCTWKIQVPDTRKIMPSGVESPHIIHPTTLDIVFHSLFAAVGNGELDLQNAAVPIGLESLTISMDHPTGGDARLKGYCNVSKDKDRDILADIYVADEQLDTPSIRIQGLRCRELPSGKAKSMSSEVIKAPIGYVVQKIDIDLLDTKQLMEHISKQEAAKTSDPDEELSNNAGELDSAIVAVIDLIAHKNPSASILQVGGVTYGLTEKLLSILQADNSESKRFKNISFCDGDQGVIEKMEVKYERLKPEVKLIHTVPGNSVLPQGLKDGSVDVVIFTSEGLADDQRTSLLTNIGRVLKLSGKALSFGLAEDSSIENPANRTEFAGLSFELLLKGSVKDSLNQSILSIATKNAMEDNDSAADNIFIVLPPNSSEDVKAVAACLEDRLSANGSPVQSVIWPSVIPNVEAPPMIVSLLEFNDSFITSLSEADYDGLKALALRGKRLLWVTKGSNPIMQTAIGFLRSLGNENSGLDYCFLHVDETIQRDAQGTAIVVERVLLTKEPEGEYIEKDGEICCSRWAKNRELCGLVGANSDVSQVESIALSKAQGGLTLSSQKGELTSQAVFVESKAVDQLLADDEVEIDIRSVLISAVDNSAGAESETREAVGIINATGNTCRFSVGTAVSTAYTGPISTKIRIHEQYCQALSPDADFEEAVLRPLTYVTVHHSLCTLAQLNSNKTILIQGGGSVVGQAGVSLAQTLGATVYASIKHHEDSLLLQGMGVSPDHILNDNESYQLTTLMSMTRGHGFDAILNTGGGEEAISQLWLCMAPGGNFIDASNNSASASINMSIKPFKIGASFNVVNMKEYLTSNPSLYKKIFQDSVAFFNDRSLELRTELPTFTADKIGEALRSAAAPTGPGNAVLLFPENVAVPVSPEVKNQLRLRADATYILAGGLGGLGRSLARLMVKSGARNIVFLSRSGPGSSAAQDISHEFRPRRVNIEFYGCDVTDAESVFRVFEAMNKNSTLPPVRGIIQCAAVLRDSIYQNMSHSQWTEAIRPKVQGTWNLHQASLSEPCAKEGLDFFVMLASISGFVGNRGQANYAAGNSYQDALAKYRRSTGLAATSVDLGLMQEIGLIAERGGQSNLNDDTVVPLGAREFELIFKLAMNSEGYDVPAQIITGLPTGGILQKQGIETTPFYYRDRRFAHMQVMGVDDSLSINAGGSEDLSSIEEQVAAATSREHATAIILTALRAQVAKALRCPADDVDASKMLHTYGMDSLMAVDMRGWVQTKLKAEISLFDVMGGSSIGMLAEKISKASKLVKTDLD